MYKLIIYNIVLMNIDKLNKSELLKIIGRMKKKELINIINNKIGGGDMLIIKETKNAIRSNFPHKNNNLIKNNKNNNLIKNNKNNNLIKNNENKNKTLPDDEEYNKMYILNNNKIK